MAQENRWPISDLYHLIHYPRAVPPILCILQRPRTRSHELDLSVETFEAACDKGVGGDAVHPSRASIWTSRSRIDESSDPWIDSCEKEKLTQIDWDRQDSRHKDFILASHSHVFCL